MYASSYDSKIVIRCQGDLYETPLGFVAKTDYLSNCTLLGRTGASEDPLTSSRNMSSFVNMS